MAGENLEVVRRIFEAWGHGDFRAGVEHYDPHVLLVLRPEFPDAGTYCGPAAIGSYTRQLLAAWDDFAITGEDFIEAGDSVVVRTRQRGRGTGSGIRAELSYFQVWTFRGPSVIRIESVWTRDDALAAVGLAG